MPKFNPQTFFEQQLKVLNPSLAAHKTLIETVERRRTTEFKFIGKRETWHVQVFNACIVFRCFEGIERAFEYRYEDVEQVNNIWLYNQDIINHIFNQ